MIEKDVIDILQRYRHDILNHLQIISGYAEMNRLDDVKRNLNEWSSQLDIERKLFRLKAPKFIMFLLQFAQSYKNLRLAYSIHTAKNLVTIDSLLYEQTKGLTDCLQAVVDPEQLHDIQLELNETTDQKIEMIYMIFGEFPKETLFEFKPIHQNVHIQSKLCSDRLEISIVFS